jgi:hypothetical protein
MKSAPLLVAIVLLSCVRSSSLQTVQVEDDKSIVFPDFFQGEAAGLDGATLQALMIASQDLFSSGSRELPCWERQEGHDYRFVRKAGVVFVYIYANPARCGRKLLAFDAGVKYAISADGRILRRMFDSEPEGPPSSPSPDAGVQEPSNEPGLSTIIQTPGDEPSRYLPSAWLDGGVQLDGSQPFRR